MKIKEEKIPTKASFPLACKVLPHFQVLEKEREKIPDGHRLVSIPSHYHTRPVDGACAAEAAVPMQLMAPCKDTKITEQGDPFAYFSCQKPKPLGQVGPLLSVEE